jgi:hypothetical protein
LPGWDWTGTGQFRNQGFLVGPGSRTVTVGWASYGLACLGCCSNTSFETAFFYRTKVASHSIARDLATSPCIFHCPIFYRAVQKRPLHLPDPSSQTRPSRRLPFLAAAAPASLSTSYAYTSVPVPLSDTALVRTLTPSTAKQGGGHPRSDGDTSGKPGQRWWRARADWMAELR